MFHARLEGDLSALSPSWGDLADRLGADPFARPDWVDAWWGAFGTAGSLKFVCIRRGVELIGLAPIVWHAGAARFAANSHTPICVMLADGDTARRLLARALFDLRPRELVLPLVDRIDPVVDLLRADRRFACVTAVRESAPALDMRGVGDPLLLLSKKLRQNVRRRRRRLEERGSLEVAITSDRSAEAPHRLDEVLDECFAVEARQWKGEQGTAIANSPSTLAFYRTIAGGLAEAGRLRLVTLRLDGRMLGFAIGMRGSRATYVLKGGFDPEYREYGIGHLLVAEQIAAARDDGSGRFEFLGDPEPFKLEWARERSERVGLVFIARGPAGLPSQINHRFVRRVRGRIAGRSLAWMRVSPPPEL